MTRIGRQLSHLDAMASKGIAVGRVLRQREIDVRHAEIDGGQALGEVARRWADDGAGEAGEVCQNSFR
jgi:hypothetical protein